MIVTDREVLKNNGAETILSDPELIDGFCDELATVLQNIDDPRTNPTKPRKIIIEFEISATSNKETIAISASTNSKIVKKEIVKDRMDITRLIDDVGRLIEYKMTEVKTEAPGQADLFGGEEPQAKEINIMFSEAPDKTSENDLDKASIEHTEEESVEDSAVSGGDNRDDEDN